MKNAYEKVVIACSFTAVAMLITVIEWETNRKAFDTVMGELHGVFLTTWLGLVILFWTGLALGVAYCVLRLNRERNVIRPDRRGNKAQLYIHRGEVILLDQPVEQLDPAKQMAMVKQVMQLSGVLARSAKQLPDTDEYEALPEPSAPNSLPTYVRYEEIAPQIPQGHALVGVGGDGIMTRQKAIKALTWIVGGSGTGKTNSVCIRVGEDYSWEHRFLVIDPHWFKDDSLYNAIKGYKDRFLMPVAYETEDILKVLNFFLTEFKRRKDGGKWEYPITIIIDEVGSLVSDKPETKDEEELIAKIKQVARICGQESRGFEMTGMYISQDAAGLAWLRKRAILVIAHQLLMMSERELATNGNKEVAREMDNWPIGRTLVYGIGLKEGQRVVQQPAYEPRKVVESTLAEPEDFYGARTVDLSEQRAAHYYQPTSQMPTSVMEKNFFEHEASTKQKVQTGELLGEVTPLEKRLPDTSDENEISTEDGKYKFAPEEQRLVVELYKAYRNIDKVLAHFNRGARWHKDASRILKDAGLL